MYKKLNSKKILEQLSKDFQKKLVILFSEYERALLSEKIKRGIERKNKYGSSKIII